MAGEAEEFMGVRYHGILPDHDHGHLLNFDGGRWSKGVWPLLTATVEGVRLESNESDREM